MSNYDLTSRQSRPFKIIIQVLYWVIILILIGLARKFGEEMPLADYIKWALVSFPFKLAIFYGYFYFFIPNWLYKKTMFFVIATILILALYPEVKKYIDDQFGLESIQTVGVILDDDDTADVEQSTVVFWQEWTRRCITVLANIIMAFFIRFTVDWFKNLRIRSQMETQQLKSELAMLRNQVNPHFLFNTLNNIDAMVYKVSSEASEAIMKLSSIMRYMLYESNVDFVPLKKEVDYIESYFELQKMRMKNQESLQFEYSTDGSQVQVAPMIFIPFIENAFKHADFSDKLFIRSSLVVMKNQVVFKVDNSIPSEPLQKDDTGGIGLQNVKRRLALIYPQNHDLSIEELDQTYSVTLKLTTHED